MGGSWNGGTPIAGWFLTLNPKQKWMIWWYPYRKPPYFCNICFITSSCSNYCCPSDVSGRKLVFHRNQQSSQITQSDHQRQQTCAKKYVYRQSVPIYQFFPCIGVNPSKKKHMFPQVMWEKRSVAYSPITLENRESGYDHADHY